MSVGQGFFVFKLFLLALPIVWLLVNKR